MNDIVNERQSVYGDPVHSFARVAQVWSGILGQHVNATDVALCMAGLKMVRSAETPDYSDNSDDIDGYVEIFRQIVGPDMVKAKTVVEYLEQKQGRSSRELIDDHTFVEPAPGEPAVLGCRWVGGVPDFRCGYPEEAHAEVYP